jgi:hypothetical protein
LTRQRLQLRDEVVAERLREIGENEGRCIARHFGRGVLQAAGVQARALIVAQGLRGEALAGEQGGHRGGGESLLEPQGADQDRAGRVRTHDPGGGRPAAQGVVDEARDSSPVAGSGEAVREAPILESVGGRPAASVNVGQNLDGGGAAGGGCQGSDPSEMVRP